MAAMRIDEFDVMEYQPNAEGAKLIPTRCCFCGRDLLDAESIDLGYGPICAEKYGMLHGDRAELTQADVKALKEAISAIPDWAQRPIEAAIKTGSPRDVVNKAVYQCSVAISYGEATKNAIIGTLHNVAQICGYRKVADRMVDFYNQRAFCGRIEDRGGAIAFFTGYSQQFNAEVRSVPKQFWDGNLKARILPKSSIPQFLQVLSSCFPDQLVAMPDGSVVTIPQVVSLLPPPTPAAPAPSKVTNELGVEPTIYQKGDIVIDREGRQRKVCWVDSTEKQVKIGLTPVGARLDEPCKGGYDFVGVNQVKLKPGETARRAAEKALAEASKSAAEMGAPPPAPVAPAVVSRKIPAAAMEHQITGIRWLDQMRTGLLADEPGLGKTFQSCVAADAPVVIVCPAAMRTEWQREMNRWRPDLSVQILKKTKQKTLEEYRSTDVVIVNYDIVSKHVEGLREVGFKTLICDEAQALKNLRQKGVKRELVGSARAEAVAKLAASISHKRFMLTATPIMNRVIELWSLLHIIDPRRWDSYSKFGVRFCAGELVEQYRPGGGKVRVWDFSGMSNEKELHAILSERYMLRRKKEILNLPPKSRFSQMVELPYEYQVDYFKAQQEFLNWLLETSGSEAVSKAKRAEAIVRMTSLRRLAAKGKLEIAKEWIVNFAEGTGRPLVVMAHHRDVTEELIKLLREQEFDSPQGRRKFRVGGILGGISDAQRTRDKDAFQRGELDVIVCSIQAAGVGLTLTRATDTLFIERAWRPADLVQAEDRIYRIGTKNACTITYLDASDTIDAIIATMLVDKQSTSDGVIDGVDLDEEGAAELALNQIFGQKKGLQVEIAWQMQKPSRQSQ